MPGGASRRGGDARIAPATARFEERARAGRRRRWRQAGWGALAAAVVAGLVWLVGWSPVLAVEDLQVQGVSGAEATAVRALADVPVGLPLARVDTADVEARVRTRAALAEVAVERSWPRTVVVRVLPRTPALVLRNPEGQLEVVDRTGVRYGVVRTAPRGVPVVTATSSTGTSPESLAAALALLDALPSGLAERVSSIRVSSANLLTLQLGKVTVVWGGRGQEAKKVAVLQALLGTEPAVIDVSAPDTPVTR
ncbi:MAG TPA: cell division protein FtsQ/DivIB [Dermatophilaceae bacterium]|nr:cell division protein FtsQ/DivIB [Dermatophilaceae bacterium]